MGGRGGKGGPGPVNNQKNTAPSPGPVTTTNTNQGGGGGGGGKQGQGSTNTGGLQGGGGSGGGGGSSSTPAPTPTTPLDKFRKLDKKNQTHEDRLKTLVNINPRHDDPKYNVVNGSDEHSKENYRSRINCQRCTVTWEAQQKGYDVTAAMVDEGIHPVPWNSQKSEYDSDRFGANLSDISRLFKKANGESPRWYRTNGSKTRPATIKELETEAKSWGDGARGILYVQWMQKSGGGAHVLNFEVRNGKVIYYDGQVNLGGEEYDKSPYNWRLSFSPSKLNAIMRVDNAEITEDGTTWMHERTILEKNAPSLDELNQRMNTLSLEPAKRIIWRHAWQQVRTAQKPTLPSYMANNPEVVAEYKEAMKWLRRPD